MKPKIFDWQLTSLLVLLVVMILTIILVSNVYALEVVPGDPNKVTPISAVPISPHTDSNNDQSGNGCGVTCDQERKAREHQQANLVCYQNMTMEMSFVLHHYTSFKEQITHALSVIVKPDYGLCAEHLWHDIYRPYFMRLIK